MYGLYLGTLSRSNKQSIDNNNIERQIEFVKPSVKVVKKVAVVLVVLLLVLARVRAHKNRIEARFQALTKR